MSLTWGNPRSQQRRGELELQELLNKPRAWEHRPSGFMRGIRNGLVIAAPIWLLIGKLMGWW